MPTINVDGIDFELAMADGEVLSVTLEDREEFMAAWGDYFADPDDPDADPEPTKQEIESWAESHLADTACEQIWWKLEPVWSQFGCVSAWHAAEGV